MNLETINYEGWDAVRLANAEAELVVTTSVGPRIIHYGLLGGPNVFHVLPETRGQSGGEEWMPYGGHRLWLAPEDMPRSYFPDTGPYGAPQMDGETLVAAGPAEHTTGIRKTLRITLAPTGPGVTVEHVLTNHNVWPVTLAAWSLSIVANGGKAVLPHEPFVSHDDALLPARPLILWQFTDMADPRWRWGTKYLTLTQRDDLTMAQKVGVYNAQGWGAHVTDTQAFVVSITPAPGGPAALADMGSNFEAFTKGPFQELETLGPVTTLQPGESLSHTERWFVGKLSGPTDTDATLDTALLPIVRAAQAAS